MKHYEHPLIREYHEEYEDIYVWKGIPGGFSQKDAFFVGGLTVGVLILLAAQGETNLGTYGISIVAIFLLSGFYKGFKVGMESLGYKPYEVPLLTRLASDFVIWSRDSPVAVEEGMIVVKRYPTEVQPGVVYLYKGETRHIVFLSEADHHLEEFVQILCDKYGLEQGEPVSS